MKIKKGISFYIIINTLFLLPIVLIYFFQVDISIAIYAVMMLLYCLFGLVYLHIAFDVVIFIYFISEKIKKKISSKFFLIYILTIVINIVLNVLWIREGRLMSVQ